MTANVTCELELTEYDRRGSSQHKKLGRHESKVDIVVDSGWVYSDKTYQMKVILMLAYFLYNSQPNVTEYIPNTVTNTPYHTAGSSSDVDAFDHILEVTTNQEAVYAYYWMDENNKVSFLKVFL